MQAKMTAPMAGKVIQIHFNAGQTVEEDDEGIVIEAMKMETMIYVPHTGLVEEIKVKVGDRVEEDDELAVIQTA